MWLAPETVEILSDLKESRPLSITNDASNHVNQKLFPLVAQFFTKDCIEIKLLDFSVFPKEDSATIFKQMTSWSAVYHCQCTC